MHALKIYLVEDSELIRENLIATLQELVSIELLGVAAGEQEAVQWLARAAAQGWAPELVIIDLFLKQGSGLGVLRAPRVSGVERARQQRIVLSNFATREMQRICLQLGADRVFDKSNDIDELITYCTTLAEQTCP